ncbi:MAG TPA: phospholipase D-like domain-containing protein [Planctomycetota bacterium]|nr:phospholipase D-like domain-containing protein [Planctomycetota bacterium]
MPEAAWPISVPVPAPAVRRAAARPAIPAIPVVAFKGLSLKGVQFSGEDRISATLVAAIDKTSHTLLLSLYDLRLPDVADAVLRAKARGVSARLVYDESHVKPSAPGERGGSPEYLKLLDAGVPIRILKGGGSFGIMHNKFAVFDGELVATGSFNWTPSADEKHFENEILRDDAAHIEGFTRYWHWMWRLGRDPSAPAGPSPTASGGDTSSPMGSVAADFGPPPADPLRPVAFAGGSYPRYAFSPRGGVEDLLVDALGRAKRTIDVAIFSLYSQRVVDALIAAAERGVAVRVAADASQAARSQPVLALSKSGVKLRLSGGRGGMGVMHHKYAVVDGALLMTGSYNFSANAEQFNFENDLFTTLPGEVAAYGAQFAAVWKQAHKPAPGELPAPKEL